MNVLSGSIIRVVSEHFKWALFSFFENNYIYLSLVLIAVAFIILYRKKMTQAYYLLILFSLPVLLIIFNPYVVSYLESFPRFNEQVSSRLWLIVPLWIIAAFFISVSLLKIKYLKIRYPVAILAAVLLIVAGASAQETGYYIRAEGRYKIRAESVRLADEILSLSDGVPASVLMIVPEEDGRGSFVFTGSVAEGISQYTGNISIHKLKYSQELWNDYFLSDIVPGDNEQTSEAYIALMLYYNYCNYGYDYVIWPADDIIMEKMGYCGYELVGQIDGYCIYQYQMRQESAKIASELLRLSEGQPLSVLVMDLPQEDTFNSVNGGSLNSGIRYYSTVISAKGRVLTDKRWEIFTSESDPDEDPVSVQHMRELFDRYAESFDYEYVVLPEDEQAIRNMEYIGFEPAESVAGYTIFVNPLGSLEGI